MGRFSPEFSRHHDLPDNYTPTEFYLAGLKRVIAYQDSNHRNQIRAIIQIAETQERRRMARELHDCIAPDLVALQLQLQILKSARAAPDPEAVYAEMEVNLADALKSVRTLSYLMHPPEVQGEGLLAALQRLTAGFQNRTGIRTVLQATLCEPWWTEDAECTLFRLAQEALTNVHAHAHAISVDVRLKATSAVLSLAIRDDGIGISPEIVHNRDPDRMGVGLVSMRERVEAISGHFAIEALEDGTEVSACLARWPAVFNPF